MARQRVQERDVKGRIRGHVPTDETRALVMEWAGFGAEPEVIARKLDLTPDTLVRHYGDEIARANPELVVELGRKLKAIAMGEDADGNAVKASQPQVTALIYALKALGGAKWADTPALKPQLTKGEEAALSRPQMPVFLPDNGRAAPPIIDATKAKQIERR